MPDEDAPIFQEGALESLIAPSLDLQELAELVRALHPDQRGKFEPVVIRIIESTKRRSRILSLIQDALSQLRLDMKYLVFDLEATRRERDALKSQLDGNGEAE